MSKVKLIAGLDIGTSTIKMLVAGKREEGDGFEVVCQAEEPSFGVRRGIIVEPEKVSRTIQILLNRIKTEMGQKINSVYVNIGGAHISSVSSRSMVAVSRADRSISKEDVDRVLDEAAKSLSLPSNNEILQVFPKEFIVDGIGDIKSVEGLKGGRLETEILVLSNFMPFKNNLIQAVSNTDLQILDIISSPLASASSVLSQKQKELGTALLDIGAGTSGFAVFEEGRLIDLAIFPIGSANITHDIAVGLKTDIDVAEKIKIEYGTCLFKGKDKRERIEAEGEDPLVFSRKMLAKIIEARVSEIFDQCEKELKKIGKQELPGGIVLTGGGANLPKIVELAKKELKLPCRIGKPSDFSGLDDGPAFATVCGLILRSAELEDGSWLQENKSLSEAGEKIKKIFKIFMP